ncbi:hypothetical protein ACJMK2_028866 [Sinanodonta woodiana]|uniref:Uncharacterized protein n=1 Tax=Sinanodonta woodiana TaxID=1069815 RepID=A0ABD3X8U3_SINWO
MVTCIDVQETVTFGREPREAEWPKALSVTDYLYAWVRVSRLAYVGTIQAQPVANENTVINNQFGCNQMVNLPRNWSSGICDCTNDMQSCLLVYCCGPFYGCYLSREMEENTCLPLWHPFYLTSLRSKMRTQRNIEGNICCDHCATVWLPSCVMCQLKRELDIMRAEKILSSSSP